LFYVKSWLYDNSRYIDTENNISTYYLTLQRFGEQSVHSNITLAIKYRHTLTETSFRRGTVGYSCNVGSCIHEIVSMDTNIASWRVKNIIDHIIYSNLSIVTDFDNSDVVKVIEAAETYHSLLLSPLLVNDIMSDLQCLKRNIEYVANYCKCVHPTEGDICECDLHCNFW
jgi:hypothetical protein